MIIGPGCEWAGRPPLSVLKQLLPQLSVACIVLIDCLDDDFKIIFSNNLWNFGQIILYLNTWTEMGLRAGQKSPAEVCPCTFLQMMMMMMMICIPCLRLVKRDFESLSLSKPYAALSLELGEDKPDHLGPGVVIITMRWSWCWCWCWCWCWNIPLPGLWLQRGRNKLFPEFSCCKG